MARRPHQLRKLAELLDVAPSELVEAIVLSGPPPPSGMINLQVRVPKAGQRVMPYREDSRIERVAKTLHLDPDDIRDAMISMYPHIAPGNTVTFQVRATAACRDLIIPEIPYAIDAVARGDVWAMKWLALAHRVMTSEQEGE